MAEKNTTGDMQDSQDNPEDTYPNAGRDSGYVAPVGEDLVNKLSILISGIETKLLIQGQQTRGDIAEIAKQQAQSDRARLLRNAEFQEHIDTRFDGLAGELDKMLASQEVLARGLGKNTSDILALQLVTVAHGIRLAEQDERYGALLHGAIARIVVLEADKARFEALQAGFDALAARIGDALPTEADQDLSAQLRVDEEARHG